MRAVRIDHVVFKLVDVPIGTEDGSVGSIEALKETVAEGNRSLGVVTVMKRGVLRT